MKYKHYIAISLLIAALSGKIYACGPMYYPSPSDYAFFQIVPVEQSASEKEKTDENIRLWHEYVNRKVEADEIVEAVYTLYAEVNDVFENFEEWQRINKDTGNKFLNYLLKTNDKEAVAYLLLAKQCEMARFKRTDSWYYPTKEDLKYLDLKEIYEEAVAYKGEKLKLRYLLQAIRAAYTMLAYDDCIRLWEEEVLALPQNYITIMCSSYIGSIYFKREEYEKAALIYSLTNDLQSLNWCLSKLGEPDSEIGKIELIYKYMPGYKELPKLIAPIIRRAEYGTIQKWIPHGSYIAWYENTDYEKERESFQQLVRLAHKVVKENKTPEPAYWQSVASYLIFLDGDYKEANRMLLKAEQMKGSVPVHNNIRVLRMLYDAVLCKYDRGFEEKLLTQLQWLFEMVEQTPFAEERIYGYRNRYTDVLERLVDYHWVPGFQENEDTNRVCGLIGLKTEIRGRHFQYRTEKADSVSWFWNDDYSTPIFSHLDTIPLNNVLAYKQYLYSKPKTKLDKFIVAHCYKNENYYDELIATKYIRLAEFKKAIPYLERLGEEFLSRQNILSYLVDRSTFTEVWNYNPDAYSSWSEIDRKNFLGRYDNKLQFCKRMIELKKQIESSKSNPLKSSLAYQYATALYHASYRGKLWAITHYAKGLGCGGGEYGPLWGRSRQLDELQEFAMSYLKLSEELADTSEKEAKSIYTQAYIAKDKCIERTYDWKENKWNTTVNWQSEQCKLYNKLLLNAYKPEFSHYIMRCDKLIDYSLVLSDLW
ncbi:hypothetical protein [Bacteroides sp. 224]|uniref:hypothetical protein n=1 Tax=Bacteroides sp. 224 TaxID=2302936 RepID=UPI0013D05637|nr:hypothetical protein [Bacteroides sp. 224]NDV64851.1 hypothetical protein [Bacteroides sp. 224]